MFKVHDLFFFKFRFYILTREISPDLLNKIRFSALFYDDWFLNPTVKNNSWLLKYFYFTIIIIIIIVWYIRHINDDQVNIKRGPTSF